MKINPSVYLKAAELQSRYVYADGHYGDEAHSRYSCDNISSVSGEDVSFETHKGLYAEYFQPVVADSIFGWWEDDENEPRIFALLLMHEIAKDLVKKKKVKKKRKMS
jgi:hypothetical protein